MLHATRLDEILRVLAFVLFAGGIYVAAIRILYRRWRKDRAPFRWPQIAILIGAIAGTGCVLYGRFVEPRWLEVTETRAATSRLPLAHRGIRIVHLSDIHSEATPVLETELPARVAELKPDLIVFTGDAANSTDAVAVFRACLAALSKIAPTFAVKGNWDVLSMVKGDQFAGTGATVLAGTPATADVAGVPVHLLGASYGGN